MREFFRKWNLYGSDADAFDKYRDAVRRSNQASVKVLSVLGISAAALMLIYGFTGHHNTQAGIVFCMVLMAAGIAGAAVSFRRDSSRDLLMIAGYVLSVSFYAIAIYGTTAFNTDAFWIGTQIAVGCYLLDYAWRVGLLQILSYAALMVTWTAGGQAVPGERILFSLAFLLAGLVTFYTVNRTRVLLITSREAGKMQADTDQLTGLMNQTAAEEKISGMLGNPDETDVLMLLDLDHFKSVNDRMGHQMGDKVLVDVSTELKKMFRNTDILSRLGGDEFIIFMQAVPEREWAMQRADQVIRMVRRWVTDGTTNIQVTASVGIVVTDSMDREYGALYRAADIAMYFAKEQGGNRAVFYTKELLEQARSAVSTREDSDAKTLAEHNGTHDDLR